jgi:hypothetical protein
MTGWESDDASGTTILVNALQDTRTLACKAVSRKDIVCLLGHGDVDFIEGAGEVREPLLARRAGLQMGAV